MSNRNASLSSLPALPFVTSVSSEAPVRAERLEQVPQRAQVAPDLLHRHYVEPRQHRGDRQDVGQVAPRRIVLRRPPFLRQAAERPQIPRPTSRLRSSSFGATT